MAIFRFSAGVIKRSAGRSATGAAAYRAGMEITDARTGQTFDYTRKGGVLHTAILTPDNAPAWMQDRAKLWNAVELGEKRHDAQLAREVQLALPHELTAAQQIVLAHEFAAAEFVSRGMVADIAIHGPDREGDERNVHAHIMLTMREIDGGDFGQKAREWNAKPLLEHWREAWADHANRALEREGHAARIDHRTLEAQGIDREPSIHLGPNAMEMERRGISTDRGDHNRLIAANDELRRQIGVELADVTRQIAELERMQGIARHADEVWKKFEPPSSAEEQAGTPQPGRQAPGKGQRKPNRYTLLIEKQQHPERAKEIDEELERRRLEELERRRRQERDRDR